MSATFLTQPAGSPVPAVRVLNDNGSRSPVWSFRKLTGSGGGLLRAAFSGHEPLADLEHTKPDTSLQVRGVFDTQLPAVGSRSSAIELGRNGAVDGVVLTLRTVGPLQSDNAISGLRAREADRAHCSLLPVSPAYQIHDLADGLASRLTDRPIPNLGMLVKTSLDVTVAFIALLLLAPLLLLIALAVRLDSTGPVIFSQRRDGCGGRHFMVRKFRTMHWSREGCEGDRQTLRRDCRVTRVGDFLRRTSLDELPQLWNVLNGTMSLVGPRPHPVAMRTEGLLGEEIAPEYPHRHRVRPGITGLAQINGHRGATTTTQELRARLADDLHYVDNWSLALDMRILLLTPLRLIQHRENAF